jgi:hypothetical protein
MPYVMVPVPEEHVEQVMQFVLRAIARASIKEWDAGAVEELWGEVDEATRSLLAFVARATLEGAQLADAEVAGRIQMSTRETIGILNDLNVTTRADDRDNLITTRVVDERLPNGRVASRRMFVMDGAVAELIGAAERAEASELRSADPTR